MIYLPTSRDLKVYKNLIKLSIIEAKKIITYFHSQPQLQLDTTNPYHKQKPKTGQSQLSCQDKLKKVETL